MNKAFIDGKEIPVAGKWNELTRPQLLRLMQVMFSPLATEEYVNTRLVAILLQLWHRPQLARIMLKMPLLEVATLRLLTQAFLNKPVQLTRQLLPTVRPGKTARSWHGPGDGLAGITYSEWIAAEGAYFKLRQEKQLDQLDRLVAVLYRPRRRQAQANGDKREDFNQHVLDRRAQEAAQLSPAEKNAILLYYDSCRAAIIHRAPELFPGKEYDDDPDPEPVNPTRNYLLLLRELAGSPDRFDIIGQQPVSNVFFDLNERIAEANRQAAELEARRNG